MRLASLPWSLLPAIGALLGPWDHLDAQRTRGAGLAGGRIGSWLVTGQPELEARRSSVTASTGLRGSTRLRGVLATTVCPATAGGPTVRVEASVRTTPQDALGFTRTVHFDSRGHQRTSGAAACQGIAPEELAGYATYRDRLQLRRATGAGAGDGDALIVQSPWRRGPRLEVRVLANGLPVTPRETNGYVEMYPVAGKDPVSIELAHAMPTALPPPPWVGTPCADCLPRARDSSGVSIATVSSAMDRVGLRQAPGRRGWTTLRSVLSRSAFREAVMRHVESMGTGCTTHPAFDTTATVLCAPPVIRFLPGGVEVELTARPIHWLTAADTAWSRIRLLYPLRHLQGALYLREASVVEVRDPIQTIDAHVVQRLGAGAVLQVLPVSWELRAQHARPFGNACLMPDTDRAESAAFAVRDGDVLEVTFNAPVVATMSEACALPFPVERARPRG